MPTIEVTVSTPLSPDAVVSRLTDFSPGRAEHWSNVDPDGVTVHDSGEGWADVTEGNRLAWERERYTWSGHRVEALTTDSNVWGPGSKWVYEASADGTGSSVRVTAVRNPKGVRGALVAALLTLVGRRFIAKGVSGALRP